MSIWYYWYDIGAFEIGEGNPKDLVITYNKVAIKCYLTTFIRNFLKTKISCWQRSEIRVE